VAATPSLRVIKSFTYRGNVRLWSNRYHFNGGVPASDSAWHTLMDNVTTAEQLALSNEVTIVEAIGYLAGSDVPVSSKTYTKVGSLTTTGFQMQAGDVAAMIRWATAVRTSKNHPVFLFNYFHSTAATSAATPDIIAPTYKTALNTYASGWISGFSDGSVTYNRAGPNGASATGFIVDNNLRHRDFPN
jgi:hypothetical protein